jgi:predicted dehydrogenase
VPDPVRVGLVGAGTWARAVTGPVLAASPETEVAGVWSRTAAHAASVAHTLGVRAFDDLDALFAASDAIAIAVAPDAQPAIATRAAVLGKALLLEKPIAANLPDAEALAATIASAGVPSLVMLTYRFHPLLPAFVERASQFAAAGGRACFLSGAFLPGSPYANGWRLEQGALLDVGPHLLDLLELALGPIVDIRAAGDRHGCLALTGAHDSGATSQASLCCVVADESRTEVELFGPNGSLQFDGREGDRAEIGRNLARAFAAVARGGEHPSDVQRGLHLQRLIDTAERQLS